MKPLLYFFIWCVLLLFVGCGTVSLNMKTIDYPVAIKYKSSLLLKPAQIKTEFSGYSIAGVDPIPDDFESGTISAISDLTSHFFQSDPLNPQLILTPTVRSLQVCGQFSWSDVLVSINITWTFTDTNGDIIANYFVQGDTISSQGSLLTKNSNEEERFKKVVNEVFQKSFQLFHSSYTLREFDLCESLYSIDLAHQKSTVMEMLSKTKDENERQSLGTMIMCYAARTANKYLMEFLIQQGIAANETEYFSGYQPIHVAALFGNTEIVELLLDSGVEINSKSTELTTPLLYAVYQGHEDTWQLLLDKGASIEAKSDSNFYKTAILYQMFGDYLAKTDNSPTAAESYLIASNNFNIASSHFEKLSDEIGNDSWWSIIGNVLINSVLAYDAQLKAKQMAEFTATISPSGKGYGVVMYKQYQYQKSSYSEAEMEAEYSRLAEECKENSIKCKKLADSFK